MHLVWSLIHTSLFHLGPVLSVSGHWGPIGGGPEKLLGILLPLAVPWGSCPVVEVLWVEAVSPVVASTLVSNSVGQLGATASMSIPCQNTRNLGHEGGSVG